MKKIFFIRIQYLIFATILFTSCKSCLPYTDEMKSDLSIMFNKDQTLQNWDPKRISDESYRDSMRVEFKNETKKNCEVIKKYYAEYSFPGIKENGKEASMNFWLIIQHSDHDVIFQEQVLKSMKKELKHKNVSSNNYAFLCDRVLKNKGEKQLYGTQISWETGSPIPYPLKYPEKIDLMRNEMGLEPIQEYLNSF